MAASIGSICAKDTCIGSTCAMGIWIGCAGVGGTCTGYICARGIFAGNVEPRELARSGVILIGTGAGINDCCCLLSLIGLKFSLTKGLIYQDR